MEIEKFEADIKFVKSKIEEADEMMERMRADLEERKEEGDANEVGLLKAALFDVMEAQEERRKVIATIKKGSRNCELVQLRPVLLCTSQFPQNGMKTRSLM